MFELRCCVRTFVRKYLRCVKQKETDTELVICSIRKTEQKQWKYLKMLCRSGDVNDGELKRKRRDVY